MTEQEAFNVLTQALQIANQKGAFQLQDSAQIYQALALLSKQFEVKEELKEELPKNKK